MEKDKFNFYEEPSKKHRDQVFQAVQKELAYNKKRNAPAWQSLAFKRLGSLSVFSVVIAAFLYFQVFRPFSTDPFQQQNIFTELAALSPDEREVIENLELMKELDKMSIDQIEEITL